MDRRFEILCGCVLVVCTITDPAWADTPTDHRTVTDPARRHPGGNVFLRIAGGLAVATTNPEHGPEVDPQLTGIGYYAAGANFNQNMALHVDVWIAGVENTDLELRGYQVNGEDKGEICVVGLGSTRFWAPSNIYVSLSAGSARVKFTDVEGGGFIAFTPRTETALATRSGFGAHLLIGKEWWLTSHLGLGVALQFALVSTRDHLFNMGGLAGSLTFN